MDFFNQMKTVATNDINYNRSVTENGAIGYSTTGKKLLDINFKVASLRNASNQVIKDSFIDAYFEDPRLAILWLFYVRDVREGLGERRLFRVIFPSILETIERNTSIGIVNELINLISEYGRFDDLYCIVESAPKYTNVVAEIFKKQLDLDLTNMNEGKSVSLLAKWLKSENASSKESKMLARQTMKMLNMSASEYRKTLSKLRKYIDVTEIKMSNKEWDKIDYEKVPSRASLIYKNAFLKNDNERYKQFILNVNNGVAKINASTLYPHDIVNKYSNGGYYQINRVDESLEALWKNLPNTLKDKDSSNTLVVADGSGSMTCKVGNSKVSALDVANALAIYFAERATGPYKNKYITFSSRPQFVDFTKCVTLKDKINLALKHDEVADTNIEKVFDLILDTAIKNNLSQDEIVHNILIISDMEFNSCARCNGYGKINESLFQTIAKKYEEKGYKLPKLIFWNVNSRTGTIPVIQNDLGVSLVSGFSTNIVKMVLDNEVDPYKCLVKVLESDRYKKINDILIN